MKKHSEGGEIAQRKKRALTLSEAGWTRGEKKPGKGDYTINPKNESMTKRRFTQICGVLPPRPPKNVKEKGRAADPVPLQGRK